MLSAPDLTKQINSDPVRFFRGLCCSNGKHRSHVLPSLCGQSTQESNKLSVVEEWKHNITQIIPQ